MNRTGPYGQDLPTLQLCTTGLLMRVMLHFSFPGKHAILRQLWGGMLVRLIDLASQLSRMAYLLEQIVKLQDFHRKTAGGS